MEKEYRYRKHIRYLQYALPAFLGTLVLIGWIIIGAVVLSKKEITAEDIVLMVVIGGGVSFFLLLEALFIWFFYRRFNKVVMYFKDHVITYKNVKGQQQIALEDIVKVKSSAISYIGGWLTIHTANQTIRLTVVLEHIGDFVKDLKDSLDQIGKSDVYHPKALFSFYKTAEFSDQSWERIYDLFFKIILYILFIIAISAGVAVKIYPSVGVIWAIFWILAGTGVYLIPEAILGWKMSKGADESSFYCPKRNISLEKKVFRAAAIIFGVIFTSISACIIFLG